MSASRTTSQGAGRTQSRRQLRPTGRPPGRPPGGDAAVRDALLETARGLFLSRGFTSVTIRQIAAAAGSSPATIHYHFGDKLGLYRAMLETAIAPVVEALQGADDATRATEFRLVDVIDLYTRMLAENPWVPALIVQEVLTEGGPFREQFIEQFAGRLAPLLVAAVRREQLAGTVRPDVEPRLAALSAISLTVFPFLALPVAGRVLGLTVGHEATGQLAAHTTRVLMRGIGGAPEGST
jgi:TetR/AcrR family transcriptional regulator